MDAIDRALAAQASRASNAANQRQLTAALRRQQNANEWPRCGAGWPATKAEERDEALIQATQLKETK